MPGILFAAGVQILYYIDDQIIADNGGKLTNLKGCLSQAGDIFPNVSGE